MQKVDILMATYNGARYLPQQLCSLITQSMGDWTLYVHDDGSTDGTIAILEKFAAVDKRIRLVKDGVSYHNPALNFLHLLQYSTAPFTIFCDQDDIWLDNKLEKMYGVIAASDNSVPLAVYSNAYVYDADKCNISGRATIARPTSLKDVLFMNGGVQGCAIMFNSKLKYICKDAPEVVAMHDHLVTLSAIVFGKMVYVDWNLMLYRRHVSTVTGKTYGNKMEKARDFFSNDMAVLDRKHYQAICSFYEKYEGLISSEAKDIFSDFFKFVGESKIRRFFHVFSGGYRLYGSRVILALKMLIRPLQ